MSVSKNESSTCSASGQSKCTPACLLLFVGFIIGFSVGYGTHDIVYKALSQAIVDSQSGDLESPLPMKDPAEKPSGQESEGSDAVTDPAQPEETKPEGEGNADPAPTT